MKAQYAILRFAKYKGPEIGHIESHNERTKEKYASNPDVDTARSHLNFHLVTPQRKYRAEAEKQIAEAGCRTRSDSVRVVEALVTASPEFFKGKKKGEIKAYFQEVFGTFSHTFQLEIINTKCCPKPHKYCYLWFPASNKPASPTGTYFVIR